MVATTDDGTGPVAPAARSSCAERKRRAPGTNAGPSAPPAAGSRPARTRREGPTLPTAARRTCRPRSWAGRTATAASRSIPTSPSTRPPPRRAASSHSSPAASRPRSAPHRPTCSPARSCLTAVCCAPDCLGCFSRTTGTAPTLVKRMVTGRSRSVHGVILGDTKPDYTNLIRYLGGHVDRPGTGRSTSRRRTARRVPAPPQFRGASAPLEAAPAHRAADGAVHADPRGPHHQRRGGRAGAAVDLLTSGWDLDRPPSSTCSAWSRGPELRHGPRRSRGPLRRAWTTWCSQWLLCTGSLAGVSTGRRPPDRPVGPASASTSPGWGRPGTSC